MTPVISPPAAVVAVPAYPCANGLGPLAAAGLPSRGTAREARGRVTVAIAGRAPRRLFAALGDLGGMLLVIYAVPVAILALGTPIALLVRLAMWIVGGLRADLSG